jgi:hypothetical protein
MSKAISAVKGDEEGTDANELSGGRSASTQTLSLPTISTVMSHTAPPLITSAVMLALIFGGCCSNVCVPESASWLSSYGLALCKGRAQSVVDLSGGQV